MLRALLAPFARLIFDRLDEATRAGLATAARREALARFLAVRPELETVARIVQSQRFRTFPRPEPRALPEGQRVLVLAPHQDDETLGAGGTLLRCLERGRAVRVVYLTDGESERSVAPGRMAALREAEARRVWDGAGLEGLVFLRFPAGRLPRDADSIRRLRDEVAAFAPDCVFAPSPFEEPADHRRTTELLCLADRLLPLPDRVEVWLYQVTGILAPNVVVDVTELIERRQRLNEAWISQNAFFNWAHMARGLAAYNSLYLPKRPVGSLEELTLRRPVALYAELFHLLPMPELRAFAASRFEPTTVPVAPAQTSSEVA